MGNRRRGRNVRRNRSKMKTNTDEVHKKSPHTMIFARGLVGQYVRHLANDLRYMFEPFTATNLRVKRRNTLKDFVAVAGQLKVSHLLYFTRPRQSPRPSRSTRPSSIYLRLVKTPTGPTLTFKVLEYTLQKNVQSYVRRSAQPAVYHHPPLQVLHGFSGEGLHLKLMVSMIQNLLPPLNVRTVRLKTVRRVLLWSRVTPESKEGGVGDEELDENMDVNKGDVIHLRHYNIRVRTRGLSKPLRRLQRKQVPNLGGYRDMKEWLSKGAAMTDSGLSDESGTDNEVEVPAAAGLNHRVVPGAKASVHAQEIGPRLTLQLIRVEAGVVDGEVLYHRYEKKTAEEKQELQQRARAKRKAKQTRREAQANAVEAKKRRKEEHKRKCLEGMGLRPKEEEEEEEADDEDEG